MKPIIKYASYPKHYLHAVRYMCYYLIFGTYEPNELVQKIWDSPGMLHISGIFSDRMKYIPHMLL